jgi:c-di-AMP phosphodiesterase-like protein
MKNNYLSQIFEGARVTFDVNKENIQSKISGIIRKKEKENRKLAKKKYKRWSKVKGLLNFFLIMRSELFKRKIQGLTHLSDQCHKSPLE